MTICVQNRECLFGDIIDNNMRLNDAGQMIAQWYWELETKFPDIQCGDFICMPNHIHFILINVGTNPHIRPVDIKQTGTSLSRVLQWFKTMTTNDYIRSVNEKGWNRFTGRLWQRNYYEHVIRNEADLIQIQQYIADNPALWEDDSLHPLNDGLQNNK